ncbi:cell surface protein [Bifidobacterium sp. DSM 109958]|uniref:Cell surface protein n=1 Tax=Bifidobacterium moraviense TaxID=2675323 RepID=A0A7Y0F3E7_9BIFI|nr:hypothetical protein [Bifidobacterium sp. DSM 109958]NMN01159.1 cell surface protein [Bifidobacterium sp. DSM 109958]
MAYAARIRSVYGAEFAGGFTGFMQAASTASTGGLGLLYGLISVDNLLGALQVSYPTEENTKVTGPLRNLDYATWQAWATAVAVNGAYGREFAELLKKVFDGEITIGDQAALNAVIDQYVYGTNVVAGRTAYSQDTNASEGGNAGGYVGLMRSGVVTNGQAQDTRTVRATRAAGGFAGAMESGGAAKLGGIDVLGLIKLNLGKLVSVLNVFVPVVKSSSVTGYRRGMTVEATGTDLTHANGFAGGYVGYASGAQIWGDATFSDADQNGDRWSIGATHEGYTASGANATNLRRVKGANAIGGYAGLVTAAGVADVNTNASEAEGILQKLLDALINTPADLAQVVQATVSTVRGATVASVKDGDSGEAWGFTVEGAYTVGDATKYARAAGGFAGSMKAVVAGTEKGGQKNDGTDTLTVDGLRGVEGGQYAGGFVGLADTTAVASVAGDDGTDKGDQSTNLLLRLVKAGNVSALEAFRTFIHHANVNGVADGIQIKAHDSSTQGILDSKRFTGAAGGFGGGLINGTVDYGTVKNLNSVEGVNYAGGFVGHLGKAGTVDVDNASVSKLLGATVGVLDIWGSHVDHSSVTGIADGFVVGTSHTDEQYANTKGTDSATGREVAGGFAGYADLARVSDSTATNLKKVSSAEIAGGFVGETTHAYLVDLDASSRLIDLVLQIVNLLVRMLYLNQIDVIDLGKWFPQLNGKDSLFNLKVLSQGDVLYVNLFGFKIGVSVSKKSTENQQQTDVAIITIGDSVIKLPCNNDGIIQDENTRENLKVQLVKGNRTKAVDSSVTGITGGYDVFGGGATQTSDGVENLSTGYAGGFAGLNVEGVLQNDHMTYADTIRGTANRVDPFGNTTLSSNWNFVNMRKIVGPDDDGRYNTYRVYRTADAAAGEASVDVNGAVTKISDKIDDGATTFDRWDVKYFEVVNAYDADTAASNAAGDARTTWVGIKDAAIATGDSSKPLGVYVSEAKAVLMLDRAVTENNGGLTPEPDDGQDPCGEDGCQTVDLTLQKVWNDGGRADARPDSIELTVTATYTNAAGETVTPTILCYAAACKEQPRDNPMTVTMGKADGSLWSDTWRTKLTGLPVAFRDDDGTLHYYTYSVVETALVYGTGDNATRKTPGEAGYTVSVVYGAKDEQTGQDNKEYVATVTNTLIVPLPDTGGMGTAWFLACGLTILMLGAAWCVRRDLAAAGARRGRHVRG